MDKFFPQTITECGGKPLFKPVYILWKERKHHRHSFYYRRVKDITGMYFIICWWIYDHTKLFNPIPEAERFSWGKLKLLGG